MFLIRNNFINEWSTPKTLVEQPQDEDYYDGYNQCSCAIYDMFLNLIIYLKKYTGNLGSSLASRDGCLNLSHWVP